MSTVCSTPAIRTSDGDLEVAIELASDATRDKLASTRDRRSESGRSAVAVTVDRPWSEAADQSQWRLVHVQKARPPDSVSLTGHQSGATRANCS